MASLPLDTIAPHLDPPPSDLGRGASLFLDFDGTLVAIADRPDEVVIDDELRALLHRLAKAMPGRVALVSGRSVNQIQAFLHDATDGIALGGSHGAERQGADGVRIAPERPAGLARVSEAFADFARQDAGLLVEEKTLGVALHFRLAPQRETDATALAAQLAEQEGLALQHGKMMTEVRVAGDKGAVIRDMLASEPAMRGTRAVFLGDDVTDEAGFGAVAALGGAGVLVGDMRPTDARYRLPDVPAVRRWLSDMADAA